MYVLCQCTHRMTRQANGNDAWLRPSPGIMNTRKDDTVADTIVGDERAKALEVTISKFGTVDAVQVSWPTARRCARSSKYGSTSPSGCTRGRMGTFVRHGNSPITTAALSVVCRSSRSLHPPGGCSVSRNYKTTFNVTRYISAQWVWT